MEIKCPKCGTIQNETDTCIKCHVIISKYRKFLEAKNSIQLRRFENQTQDIVKTPKSHAVKVIILVIIVAALSASTMMLWGKIFKGSKGEYDQVRGQYVNEKYGFKLRVPSLWKTYSVKEAIECQTIVSEYADDYFLLASPTEPKHSMLVINRSGIDTDYFKSTPWENYVAEIASRHQVVFKKVDTIKDFRVHRVGYNIGTAYREDNLFIANGQLMEIYFYVVSPEESPQLIQEMKKVIEESLEGI